jgi:hypothetical protein
MVVDLTILSRVSSHWSVDTMNLCLVVNLSSVISVDELEDLTPVDESDKSSSPDES